MKKRFLILFTLSTIFISFLFIIIKDISADVGVSPGHGGIIEPGEKNDMIEMTSEKVVVDITKGESEYEDVQYDAHVTATFEMTNTSSEEVTLDLAFPIPSWSYAEEYEEMDKSTTNIEVSVNDEKVDTIYRDYDHSSGVTSTGVDFKVTFDASKTTNIKVEYDTFTPHLPKSIYCNFGYILETGSHWKGSIGSGEIIIQFPDEITDSMFLEYDDGFVIDNDKLVWDFKNLEPTTADNINVSYSPELFEIWNSKGISLENISASENSSFIYSEENIPENYFFSFAYAKEGSEIYLLEKMDENLEDGWIVELKSGKAPWVMYEFDAVYKVDSLNLISAIEMLGQLESANDQETFYDILNRPKQMRLTFSDETSVEIDLVDSKEKLQVLTFDSVETSSVKVEVLDTYPNFDGKDTYLGIARMQPVLGEKVRELTVEEEEVEEKEDIIDTTDDESFLEKYGLVLALAVVGVVVVGGGGTFLVVKLMKKGKLKTDVPKSQDSDLSNTSTPKQEVSEPGKSIQK